MNPIDLNRLEEALPEALAGKDYLIYTGDHDVHPLRVIWNADGGLFVTGTATAADLAYLVAAIARLAARRA